MKGIDDYITLLIDGPHNKNMMMLDSYDERLTKFQDSRPTELAGFAEHINKVEKFKQSLDSLEYNLSLDVVTGVILNDLAEEQDNWLQNKEYEIESIDNQITALKESIENDNRLYNESIINQNMQGNISFNTLESKRKTLEGYSDKIFDMCSQYGITPSDVNIDESMFTVDELNTMYDDYIQYMQKEESGSNVISKFRSICSDWIVQGIILLVTLFLCYTSVLDFVSIVFFIALIANQISSVNKSKYYSILMAITFNVKPENMGYVALDQSLLLPEEITFEMMDSDERFSCFESLYDEVEIKYEESNPEMLQIRMMQEWENKKKYATDKLNDYEKIYKDKVYRITSDVCSEIAYLKKEYERLKSEYKFLGAKYSEHLYFGDKYIIGKEGDCIEQTVTIGQRNIIFRPSMDTSLMNKFLQCMVVNALCNVAPGKLKITVYDPNDFGRSLMPLFKNELSDYIQFYNDNLNNILEELTKYIQDNFKEMSGKTIEEFNKKCEDVGMTPIQYRLLIVLSQPKTFEEDEKLKSLFEYSATGGVFIWTISDNMQSKDAFVFRRPFEGVNNPINNIIDDDWCNKVASDFITAIEKTKPKGLPWKEFIDTVIPDSKRWTGISDNSMNLYPGFLNGDPTSYKPFTVGNEGNVHVIGVGGTGAGKSVFLNHLIATIAQEYSPTEVELWLCDFKGTEFKFYLPNAQCPYMLPHIKACLCTSDGDYATSLFKALRDEADHRYEVLKDPNLYKSELKYLGDGAPIPNQKGTVGWNKYWRRKAEDTGDVRYLENLWPRILFIADEFQVIFEKASDKNLEKIRADITQIAKVGRAANVHIFFTSQSMKKTLSADILQQFTLRFALRCDREVSQEILNTTKASDIKEKFGFLIVKATGIADEDQPRYRTPFIADDVLRDHIKNMALLAEEQGIPKKDVITYEEATKHPIKELEDLYKDENLRKKLPDSGVFFLGNRMAYSANKAPDNIILIPKNNENIMSVCSDYSDLVLWFKQLMCNIQNNKEAGTVIIQSQIADLSYLTDAEKYITFPEKHGKLLSEKYSCEEMVNWLGQLLETRKASNKKDKPIYVILLGWDKGIKFGVDTDYGLRNNMNIILQTCGEFNIHVIFINTSMNGISAATVSACKYLIAAKCSVDDSMNLIGTKQAGINYEGMNKGWIFSSHDGVITRDKLYISEIEREIASNEIVL